MFPPDQSPSLLKGLEVKLTLSCAHPVELAYYAAELGRRDLCAHCGDENAHLDTELKKRYKTVLPMCDACEQVGKQPIVQRPFGKKHL